MAQNLIAIETIERLLVFSIDTVSEFYSTCELKVGIKVNLITKNITKPTLYYIKLINRQYR